MDCSHLRRPWSLKQCTEVRCASAWRTQRGGDGEQGSERPRMQRACAWLTVSIRGTDRVRMEQQQWVEAIAEQGVERAQHQEEQAEGGCKGWLVPWEKRFWKRMEGHRRATGWNSGPWATKKQATSINRRVGNYISGKNRSNQGHTTGGIMWSSCGSGLQSVKACKAHVVRQWDAETQNNTNINTWIINEYINIFICRYMHTWTQWKGHRDKLRFY